MKENKQFQQIDEISHKISDIIKSISNSCPKKVATPAKSYRMEKSGTAEKLSKLQNKYGNTVDSKQKIVQQFKEERQGKNAEVKFKTDRMEGTKWFEDRGEKWKN